MYSGSVATWRAEQSLIILSRAGSRNKNLPTTYKERERHRERQRERQSDWQNTAHRISLALLEPCALEEDCKDPIISTPPPPASLQGAIRAPKEELHSHESPWVKKFHL